MINKYLFKELNLIKKKFEIQNLNKEQFNIFSVLYKSHDEVKLHSRFIAALLDPYASHNKSYQFMNYFFKIISSVVDQDYNVLRNKFNKAIVYPEEWNKSENHNIDILIIDKTSNSAIIIENKIYAGDSNKETGGQLERYVDHVISYENIPIENILTFYLTLDKHEPSIESLGKYENLDNINGYCISYPYEITKWLNLCLSAVPEKPFIRESIIQYKNIINKLSNNNMDINEQIELRDLIGNNEEYLDSAKYLYDNFKHIKWHTVRDFWKDLEKEISNIGFYVVQSLTEDDITELTHYEIYRKGQTKKQDRGIYFEVNKNLKMYIWNYPEEWLYWGVEDNENTSSIYKEALKKLEKNNKINYKPTEWYKDCLNNNDEKIWLSNFSHIGTFNLIDPRYREKIVQKIVREISNFIENELKPIM